MGKASEPCPECGAVVAADQSCQDIFDEFLVLEFTDPGFGEVHMLTVACFMIQHGRYSDDALAWIQQQMHAHLEENVPVEHIRRKAGREANQANRTWKVTRRPGEPPAPKTAWSMTIADVEAGCRDEQGQPEAGRYRAQVRRWARTTLDDMGHR